MSLKVKIGSAVAALALVGAVGVAPANASTGTAVKTTVKTTFDAAKACVQASGTIRTTANCVVGTVKTAVSGISAKIPSLSNIINLIKSKLGSIKLPSLGGLNLSKLGGLNLSNLGGLNLSNLLGGLRA